MGRWKETATGRTRYAAPPGGEGRQDQDVHRAVYRRGRRYTSTQTTSTTFDACHIYDINEELMLAYTVIKNDIEDLHHHTLRGVEIEYLSLDSEGRERVLLQDP